MLNTQKYLRSEKTLCNLKNDLGIDYSFCGNLVILNYNQIDSPKANLIVMECRGLILENNSWNVVCYPFKRFFNYDEVNEINENFDFNSSIGLEKIDGTLVSLFYYDNKWLMSTRGRIENSEPIAFLDLSFKTLFDETVKQYKDFTHNLDKQYTYTFELVSPENRIVTVYKKRELYLLAVRDSVSLCEISIERIESIANQLGVNFPEIVRLKSKCELIDLAKNMQILQEGFVATDYTHYDDDINFRRIKIKNPAYVAIHYLKSNVGRSSRSIMRMIIDKQEDEFLSYFPEFENYVDEVKHKYNTYIQQVLSDEDSIANLFLLDYTNKDDKKTFALFVKDKLESAYFFAKFYKRVISFSDYYRNIESEKGSKYVERIWAEKLKISDIQFEIK